MKCAVGLAKDKSGIFAYKFQKIEAIKIYIYIYQCWANDNNNLLVSLPKMTIRVPFPLGAVGAGRCRV